MRLVESVHELESLSVYYRHLLDDMQRYGERGTRWTEARFMKMQSKLPFTTTLAPNVIDRLIEAAGASAIGDFNPMRRYWSDGHTARLDKGTDYDISRQHHGRYLVGMPPTVDL